MPITKSAKKRMRSSERKRVFNLRRNKTMKGSVKSIAKLITEKDIKDAEKKLAEAYKAIDKAAKRGVIKKNTAARKKSRLSKMISRAKQAK